MTTFRVLTLEPLSVAQGRANQERRARPLTIPVKTVLAVLIRDSEILRIYQGHFAVLSLQDLDPNFQNVCSYLAVPC